MKLSPQLVEAGFEQMGVFRQALDRQGQGHRPKSQSAVLVAAPKTSDIKSDVQQLVALARALTKEGVL